MDRTSMRTIVAGQFLILFVSSSYFLRCPTYVVSRTAMLVYRTSWLTTDNSRESLTSGERESLTLPRIGFCHSGAFMASSDMKPSRYFWRHVPTACADNELLRRFRLL